MVHEPAVNLRGIEPLAMALLAALGESATDVVKLNLEIEVGKLPLLTVTKAAARQGDPQPLLNEARQYRLVLVSEAGAEHAPTVPPAAAAEQGSVGAVLSPFPQLEG